MRSLPLAFTALALLAPATVSAKPRDLLPDLAQGTPTGIGIVLDDSTGTQQARLVFDSTIANVGSGPLILTGRRAPGASTMTAHQLVRRSDGSTRLLRRSAGTLRYVQEPDHQHWSCGSPTAADACGATASRASASATATSSIPADASRTSRADRPTRATAAETSRS
jgi:hypothetical protein